MVPRPASPTSLLWAHQLKREHAHLLDRMKALETSNKTLDERLKATEASNEKLKSQVTDGAQLAKRIAAFEEDENDTRNLFNQFKDQYDTQHALDVRDRAVLERRIAQAEIEKRKQDHDRQSALSKDAAITKRLDTLEAAVKKQSARPAEPLVKKSDVDVKVLSRRLETIETQRLQDGSRLDVVLDKLAVLERANAVLVEQNRRLQEVVGILNSHAELPQDEVPIVIRQTPHYSSSVSGEGPQVPRTPLMEKQARSRQLAEQTRIRGKPKQSIVETINNDRQDPPQSTQQRRSTRLATQTQDQGSVIHTKQLRSTAARDLKSPAPGTACNDQSNMGKKRKAAPTQFLDETQDPDDLNEPIQAIKVATSKAPLTELQANRVFSIAPPAQAAKLRAVVLESKKTTAAAKQADAIKTADASKLQVPQRKRKRRMISQPYEIGPMDD